MPRPPAAMRQLADLKAQLGRLERLRVRLIDNQPVSASDITLLIDWARDAITGEMRAMKALAGTLPSLAADLTVNPARSATPWQAGACDQLSWWGRSISRRVPAGTS